MKLPSLEGKIFGYLTAIKQINSIRDGRARWLCNCICGNTHEVRRTELTRGKTKSCGCKWGKGGRFAKGLVPWNKGKSTPEHVRKKQSDVKKGKPAWNKGTGTSTGRSSAICKDWKQKVLERDGHRCIRCNSEKDLCCDHIVSWKESVELRFEVSNGQTLCRSCHLKKSIEHGEVKCGGFKKGDAYWKGKKRSEETIRKMSESKKGVKFSEKVRKNMSEGQKKRKDFRVSDDDVRKIRELRKNGTRVIEIAETFGVQVCTIYRILNKKSRAQVK